MNAPVFDLSEVEWKSSFDDSAPFYDVYVSQFGCALEKGDVAVLDLHREAIYYLVNDVLVVKVVARLLNISTSFPGCSFIESVLFYVNSKIGRSMFLDGVERVSEKEIRGMLVDIDYLVDFYLESGDSGLVDDLVEFKVFLLMQSLSTK